ncbi:MAG: TonB-dependent receptor, partial [Phenylobacterium sp.]|nr:TonB-dependent receptor [Phenylobacterium sp.]
TLILLNGRRLSATSGGDLNTIPMDALASIEVLKEGASATYGAGAVGGVVNFSTRRDIDGVELTLGKTFYAGSDGAYRANLLTGWVGDNGNIMLSATYEKEDSMLAVKRDFGNLPFSVNPGGWSLSNTTARFHRYANWATAQPANAAVGSGGGTVSAHFNDFTSNADCAALGGALTQDLQPGGGATTPTLCAFTAAPWTDMVQGFKRYQVYAEGNVDLSDTMELHVDVSYNKYDTTGRRPPGASPIAARAMDPSVSTTCGTTSCYYLVPFQQAVYTQGGLMTAATVQNPFIADFNARQPGTANDVGPGMALLTSSVFRPYLFGGHPQYDYGPIKSRAQRERFATTLGLKGRFSDATPLGGLLDGVTYDLSGQYSRYVQTNVDNGDWLANRFQDALMGYGGPACNAVDRVATDYSSAAAFNRTIGIQSDTAPGTNGCLWFNPFQSNFQTSAANGAANPNHPTGGSPNWAPGATQGASTGPAGFINDPALIDWMWAERSSSLTDTSFILDALFTGRVSESVFTLPGGQIGWAVGSQFRRYERSGSILAPDEEERRLLLQQCPYTHTGQAPQPTLPPGQRPISRGCAGVNGTGNFYSLSRVLYPGELVTESTDFDSQVVAYFGELSLPILDNLNVSASVRHESFNGGKLKGTIWSAAGKWDVTDSLYVRASYGTNFRATDALNLTPGASQLILAFDNTRFGPGYNYPTLTTVDDGIRPETAVTYNFGVGYQAPIFAGRLTASVDFFGIEITDEVVTSNSLTVIDNVFRAGAPGAGSPAHLADCSASLISFVEFNSGGCQPGVTTAANVSLVNMITRNGPSLTTNGLDYAIVYTQPLFGGDIALAANATQYTKFATGAFEVNGVVFDAGGDRLGFRNTTRTGSPSQKWRANASVRWSNGTHSIGLRANYFDGFENDPAQTRVAVQNLPGTANDVFSDYGWGKERYVDFDLNYIYTAPAWQDFTLRVSVLNLTDERPPALQNFVGYDTLVGNPRGRMLRLETTKKF